MTLPNIIIPGAPKAGTTSIAAMLNQHPDIFIPSMKEPRFFISEQIINLPKEDPLKQYLVKRSILNFDQYKILYKTESKFKIDASIQYLFYFKDTIPKIKDYLGDPYIFLILRNPIPRALSNYVFNQKTERCGSLIEAIKDELAGNRDNLNSFFHYYKQGLYYDGVKLFMESFSNVKVLFYEDFAKDNLSFVNEMLGVLGISELEKIADVPTLNVSGKLSLAGKILIGRYSFFSFAYKYILPLFYDRGTLFVMKMKLTAKYSAKDEKRIKLNSDEMEFLKNLYNEDVSRLMQLLGIQKCPWKDFKELTNLAL
jgi:hypothetical protein